MGDIDAVVIGGDNPSMAKKKTTGHRRIQEKKNQFGQTLAKAIKTTAYVWKCSECGTLMPLAAGKKPIRCSNRKTCGRLFHNEET